MKHFKWAALPLAVVMGAGIAAPAHASREGRRNTAIALGAVAAYGVVKKNPTIAGLGTAGALYSYTASLKKDRHRRRRWRNRRVVYVPVREHYYHGGYYRGDGEGRGVPPGWSHGRKVGWYKH